MVDSIASSTLTIPIVVQQILYINIDNDSQKITLKFQNEADFKKVAKIMETLWDNAVDMLTSAMEGDISRLKDIPNLDD